MTETNTVRIYEFRSGFTYQSCGKSWRSTGFYGSPYIGSSFHDGFIPESLQRAARREDSRFDVSQKIDYQSFINSPHQSRDLIGFKEFNEHFVRGNALVGRIIEEWAVLTVISVAIDFGNRPFPVKRYFCCLESKSNDGNYDAMATLIEFFFDKGLENLTFDILGEKPKKSHQVYPFSSEKLKLLGLLNSYYSKFDGLRLLKPDLDMSENNLLEMWKTSLSLVAGNRKKAAWAFNVDSVANLTDFTLIQAGTKEFFYRNYSTVSPHSNDKTTTKRGTSDNLDAESVFYDFIENGNLSQEKTEFITTDIQQNYEQWEKLATKSRDEIMREFKSFSSLIRYYTLSALIVPEIAVDLFQQLLVSQEDIWDTFLTSAKYKYFAQIQNDPYFKNSIEEGVWLILNNIVEGGFLLLPEKHFRLRLYQLVKLKRFFTEKDNIWIKGIWWSIQKFILSKSSNTGQQQESSSSSFQIFYRNLEDEQYRKRHIKGYEKITQIFSQISNNISHDKKTEFLFFRALIEQKLKGKVSHRIYSTLNKKARNYPLFSYLVKETTIWDNLWEILNLNRRKIGSRSPKPTPSINKKLTNITKKLLTKITIALGIFSLLSLIVSIVLGLLLFGYKVVISFFALAILLMVITYFLSRYLHNINY